MEYHPFIHLDCPLLYFKSKTSDAWTIRDAVRGTQIFGGIGSGKTSGSGRAIAHSFLKNGFGGLVLCAKKDEVDSWRQYAQETGRTKSLLIFSEHSDYRFNFLDYEMKRPNGGGKTRNLANLFMNINEMGQANKGGQKGEDRFWDSALQRLLMNIIDLIKLSGTQLTVSNMALIVNSAPKSLAEIDNETWQEESYCLDCIVRASEQEMDDLQKRNFQLLRGYWLRDYATLDEKTRSILIESFQGLADPFCRGLLSELFATTTSKEITPERTHEGYIIILDISVQEYLQLGVYAQCIYKLLWQQATERRDTLGKTRPVFLWIDEAQMFLNKYDMLFQTTARSSKACTVFLSQNISNYYSVIGGSRPEARVDSLLANLSTKIFHSNNDAVTNEWASRTIGKDWQWMFGSSTGETGGKQQTGSSANKQFHYQYSPVDFTRLKGGGQMNNFLVDTVITVAGRTWSNGKNYIEFSFNQNF